MKVPHLAEPFSAIQVDVVGLLYRTSRGNEFVVTMIDGATRFVHAEAVRKVCVFPSSFCGCFALFGDCAFGELFVLSAILINLEEFSCN